MAEEAGYFEMCDCVNTLLREIANHTMKQRDVAQTYHLALRSGEARSMDWGKVNRAIIERWSLGGLKRIKRLAWSGRCFAEAR